MSARHYIRTQTIELDTGPLPVSGAQQWYEELEHFQRTRLLPALERAFDAVAGADKVVHLDRLELELSWEEARGLRQIDLSGLTVRVREQLMALPTPIPSVRSDGQPAAAASIKDQRQPLLYYLRTGLLPWSVDALPLVDPPPALHGVLEKEVTRLLGERPSVARRIHHLRAMGEHSIYRQEVLAKVLPADLGRSPETLAEAPGSATAVRFGNPPMVAETTKKPSGSEGLSEVNDRSDPGVDPVFLNGAGLVLLHPYVGWLLEKTGAGDDLPRAAALLHHAVWGRASTSEWDLPLIKILLGLRPEEVLIPGELTDEDGPIIMELLTGVLEHWAALGSTGPDGLRANFLQRPGKLEPEWVLTVERQPYDVLLDRLPWGIGLVKTGFMEAPMKVNWV